MTANAPPRSSLASESLLFAGRLLTHWRRAPTVPIQALLFPTFLLITFKLLVGKSMVRITGTDSLYGLVPMCAVAGAMFGALGAGLTIIGERDSGLLSQLWVLPVNRASALVGRLLAEAARTFVGAAMITAVGVGLGLRFEGGWLSVIPFLLVPVLVVVVFSTAVIAIAVRAKSSAMLFWLAMPYIEIGRAHV
jgi:ABC-2 type transport system permease protein